jgi:hypothetical protein
MTRIRLALIGAGMTACLLTGGVIGATVFQFTSAAAATPSAASAAATASPAPNSGSTSPGSGSGTFKSNEDPTHEQGESAAREAQENAGQRPTVP